MIPKGFGGQGIDLAVDRVSSSLDRLDPEREIVDHDGNLAHCVVGHNQRQLCRVAQDGLSPEAGLFLGNQFRGLGYALDLEAQIAAGISFKLKPLSLKYLRDVWGGVGWNFRTGPLPLCALVFRFFLLST